MKKILITLTAIIGMILPTQAFAESDSYITFFNTNVESYAVQIQFDSTGNAAIQYSYASDLCRMYEHSSVDVAYDPKGVGTFHYDDITGTIDSTTHQLTIQKR